MISQIYIDEWSKFAPWLSSYQIEQDLIITTALLKIYQHPELRKNLAFRGGTALNKLYFKPAIRYSEDIDLVQILPGPIGPTIDLFRETLSPFLGKFKLSQGHNTTLLFPILSEDNIKINLKIEIRHRENFSILGYQEHEFVSNSSYYPGKATITSYKLEELLGTKIRCLYQRAKGRDLYDLYTAIKLFPNLNKDEIIQSFKEYIKRTQLEKINKLEFIKNMEEKLTRETFLNDINPLLAPQTDVFNPHQAYGFLLEHLFEKL